MYIFKKIKFLDLFYINREHISLTRFVSENQLIKLCQPTNHHLTNSIAKNKIIHYYIISIEYHM